MVKIDDLTGKVFGEWTVLKPDNSKPRHWICECSCGTTRSVYYRSLTAGLSKTCGGCKKLMDLTGQKFSRWTVIGFSHIGERRRTYWRCKCDCGEERDVWAGALRNGRSKSCGCLARELMSTTFKPRYRHGMKNTRMYGIWVHMICRCENPNDHKYNRYGGRGIIVCESWREDFLNFYEWSIANGYSDELTIDRIDNDGNYEPENCRWATKKQQSSNRSTSRFYTIGSETKCLSEWCEQYGMEFGTVRYRLDHIGMPIETALTHPNMKKKGA